MSKITGLWTRLRRALRRRRFESEMAEEMRHHIEAETARRIDTGEDPITANRRAAAEFGSVDARVEEVRETQLGNWIEQAWQDLRYATRNLWKTPGFAAAAVLSLGLAIGANTVMFSLIDEILLKPIAAKNPEELIHLRWEPGRLGGKPSAVETTNEGSKSAFPSSLFDRLKEDRTVLSGLFATYELPGVGVTVDDDSKTGSFHAVSGNTFHVLGVSALSGRVLLPEDDTPGAHPVAVVSLRFSQKRFGGNRNALGRTIFVNQVATTIVGIVPNSLNRELYLPLSMIPQLRPNQDPADQSRRWRLHLTGRLQSGVSTDQAVARLDGIFREALRGKVTVRNSEDYPRLSSRPGDQRQSEVHRQMNISWMKPMTGMVVLVLLAACTNVANLLLARGVTRRQEFAVRLALGASKARLIRQLLIESGLLALLGTVVGLLVSRWNLTLLAMVFPVTNSNHDWLMHLPLDWRVAGFTAAIGLLTAVCCGLLPAWRATRIDISAEFQGGTRGLGGGALPRLGQILVVIQVAVSIVLLTGTGLFLQTIGNVRSIDLGINQSNLLLFTLNGNGAGISPNQFAPLPPQIAQKIEELPGIRSVSYSGWHIIDGSPGMSAPFALAGSQAAPGRSTRVKWNQVAGRYFETYETPLATGRSLNQRDHDTQAEVAVINQTLAQQYFPNQNPIGRIIDLAGPRKIVGVVHDAKQTGHDWKRPVEPMVFTPFSTDPGQETFLGRATFVVRTEAEPWLMNRAIRQVVSSTDMNLALHDLHTQDQRLAWLFIGPRFFAYVAGFLGVLALILATLGLFGLMSHSVVRRTGEIGVRMALGALPGRVQSMIIRESLSIVLVGAVAGVVGAYAFSQVIAGMLYGISPGDPLTYVTVVGVILGVALVACWLPARRATLVDPIIALRCE